jgi:hypothetical protein
MTAYKLVLAEEAALNGQDWIKIFPIGTPTHTSASSMRFERRRRDAGQRRAQPRGS